jgi:hypothetical protein
MSLLQLAQTVTDAERGEEAHKRTSLLKKEVKARQAVPAHKNLSMSEDLQKGRLIR